MIPSEYDILKNLSPKSWTTEMHTHWHTHIFIYVYMYTSMHVCVCEDDIYRLFEGIMLLK